MRVLVVLLLCLPCAAHAAPTVTAWLGFGHASVEIGLPGLDISDTGLRAGVHVDLGRWLGFEFGWADLGSSGPAEFTFEPPLPGFPNPVSFTAEASAAWVAYAPVFTTESWAFGPRVGFARLSFDERPVLFQRDDSSELLVGAFAAYRIPNSRVAVRVDAEAIGGDARSLAVSVSYGF